MQKASAQNVQPQAQCSLAPGQGVIVQPLGGVPTEFYSGNVYPLVFSIINDGGADAVIKKVCISGISPDYISEIRIGSTSGSGPCIETNIPLSGKKVIAGNIIPGNQTELELTLDFKDLTSDYTATGVVDVVYQYSTDAFIEFCAASPISKQPACTPGEVRSICVSGGPIQIQDVKVNCLPSGKVYVTIKLIANNIYTEGTVPKIQYEVSTEGFGDVTPECTPRNEITVGSDGTATIMCTIDLSKYQDSYKKGFIGKLKLHFIYDAESTYTFPVKVIYVPQS